MDSRRLSASSPLQQPAATVVRGHTERLIQEADVAICRLADPNDVQALHDSRVALRRLRGWLRAFDIELSVKPKRRKALRRLARSTNKARDTEVSLEWLATLERKMYPKALVGLARFSTELRGMRDKDYRRVRRELPQAWRKLAHKMRRTALNGAGKGTPRPFQQDFMASLQAYGQDFERALARARRTPTPPRIHALRIAGKRVRYLMETLLPWHPKAEGFMREMKALHDTAGAIQDLQRLIVLSEHSFLHQAGARYRRLLAQYLDGGADHRTLKRPDFTPSVEPLLWICRAAGQAQADYILRFKKTYLGRTTPVCIRELRLLTVALGKGMTTK